MSTPTKKRTICALCEQQLILSSQILLNGCPNCGSFKFKTYRDLSYDEKKEQELEVIVDREIQDTDIKEGLESIRLTSDGVFEVDIDKLLSDSNGEKPIVSRNKDGSYHIKFQTTEENEEND